MNDRELLELAAKAAGIESTCWSEYISDYDSPHYGSPALHEEGIGGQCRSWNPLIDDGDALRLMARLNINISYRENINGAWVVAEHEDIQFCPESLDGPHEYDATRRAIVRAAAEIGRAM